MVGDCLKRINIKCERRPFVRWQREDFPRPGKLPGGKLSDDAAVFRMCHSCKFRRARAFPFGPLFREHHEGCFSSGFARYWCWQWVCDFFAGKSTVCIGRYFLFRFSYVWNRFFFLRKAIQLKDINIIGRGGKFVNLRVCLIGWSRKLWNQLSRYLCCQNFLWKRNVVIFYCFYFNLIQYFVLYSDNSSSYKYIL